ncbi:UNVERIFIED_CONTAM: hypothetical protein Sradi_0824100 [Sesamum radiatum]|uniref:Uncharacterized protein n=1 Tax=Sesamum radiatum TaxID=300843 RepID=A0AAW2VVT6_SESRA
MPHSSSSGLDDLGAVRVRAHFDPDLRGYDLEDKHLAGGGLLILEDFPLLVACGSRFPRLLPSS